MSSFQRIAVSAVLLATACGGGSSSGSDVTVTGTVTAEGAPDAQRVSLDMTDSLTFVPNVIDAKAGSLTMTVKNAGDVPHNLVFDDSSLGKTGTVKGRGTATLTVRLAKAGTYRFVCTFHSGMDGKVVVTG
ncbi:MAG: cupredoxin domain-containing protein [Actinomycetota bacterium]|nr:cupredoxin domain-containing protein [Actinomycetota bacterium]